ncbi:Conserved_hypothetical protein [Hexamita inflata]|uniref:HNH nuclease domain-containing protein n=1 Tax=Hexamita inflata TaxID=28002 RepID=A0AA86RLG4_9EUKA|nr:Conserved hypothetical protein [Hexamita inflata]
MYQSLSRGYLVTKLSNNGFSQHRLIHVLVAEAFIQIQNGLQIDHIDRNRLNNHYTNLRYVTNSENSKNRTAYKGKDAIYVDQIPERCIEVTEYNQHRFENYFINPSTYEMYYYNDLQYRQLNLNTAQNGSIYYCTKNNQNKQVRLCLSVLKSQYRMVEQVE